MKTKILLIALVPICLALILLAVNYIFGLLSAPSNTDVVLGVVLLSLLIFVIIVALKKILK